MRLNQSNMTMISDPRGLLEYCRGMRTLFFACETVANNSGKSPEPPFADVRDTWSQLHNKSTAFPFHDRAIVQTWEFVLSMTPTTRAERLQRFDDDEARILRDIDENGDGHV